MNNCSLHSQIEPLEARIAPAVFVVNSLADPTAPGKVTLRDALAMADSHPGPDTIVFKLPPPPLHGQNVITLDGHPLTSDGNVSIIGPGPGQLIISGNGASGVFVFNSGNPNIDSPVTISDLSIVDGNSSGKGGGIYSLDSLTLKSVVISGNVTSANGGGVAVASSGIFPRVKIINSAIKGNSATGYSGGLDLFDLKSITLDNSLVTDNVAGDASGGMNAEVDPAHGTGISVSDSYFAGNTAAYAGGLAVADSNTASSSKITIANTIITGNTSTAAITTYGGGGLLITAGKVTITGSRIFNNSAVYDGGGIFAKGFASLTISDNTTVIGNQTTKQNAANEGGGGIFLDDSGRFKPATIIGSDVVANRTPGDGGGVFAQDGVDLSISKSSISGNDAVLGGGLWVSPNGGNSVHLAVNKSLFSSNFATAGGGIYISSTNLATISNLTLTDNIASDGDGGGICAIGDSAPLNVKNLMASADIATGLGGAVFMKNSGGGGAFTGGSIEANAAKDGGGIYLYNTAASIESVTISDNSATSKGGGVFNGGFAPGTVTLTNDSIVLNIAPIDPDISGPFTFI
jgi:hypothetical protein